MPSTRTFSKATLAVLAGGQSSRMGYPKAELQVGSEPILAYLLKRWRWDGPTLLIIAPGGKSPPGVELFDAVAEDAVPAEGPLRGILTALEQAMSEIVVVATVDMPAITVQHLQYVCVELCERAGDDAVMLHRRDNPRAIEPFPSAYRRQAARFIRTELEAGRRAVHKLGQLPSVTVLPAPANWESNVWTNLNTPSDLKAFFP